VVEAVLKDGGLLSLSLLALSLVLGGGGQSLFLFLLSLRGVFAEELEEVGRLVLVESLGELMDGGGNLESLQQDSLLSLKNNVFGPSQESGQISLGLNVTTNSVVSGILFEKGVSLLFDLFGTALLSF